MGYDLERFVGYVNEGLLCCVCRDVLERPLQAPCEHAYCSACISSWLVHHHSCPEDRLPLDVGSLKPLYRYMRNDLTRLQIRCVNAAQGCEVVCSLETLHTHEDECEFAFISCSNTGCPVQVERRGLEAHLSECNFRSRECPNGCGHTLLSTDQSQHNCVAELRTEVEMLRDAVQGGGSETRDGVSVGLTEETYGAERVAAEERGGGAQGSVVPRDVRHASPVRSRASETTGAGRSRAGKEGTAGAPQRPAANQESTFHRTGSQGRASGRPADIWMGTTTHGADKTPAEGGIFTCLQSITTFSSGHKYIRSTSVTSAG
ncbi:RING finger protein 151 isoform X3 [Dicentrarchus labrax]|uniref:RING finger protein 151 isoform X3 n=1 Tax=Dicentrarchus labrax TaxID=13489 RepID=UPI0021F65BF9|nr:RING finger protein 151 isoform X3 [Dicentrarchus labrax]